MQRGSYMTWGKNSLMSGGERVQLRLAMLLIEQNLKDSLEKFSGSVPDYEAVRAATALSLERFVTRKVVNSFEVGKVSQLWQSWTFKQKSKWFFHRYTPFLRSAGFKLIKEIEKHNISEYEKEREDPEIVLKLREIPDHLTPYPKIIYVTDIKIKPMQSLDFIKCDFMIGS